MELKKWNKVIASVVSATLLFAGCSIGGDAVASVNGQKIGKDVYEKTLGLYSPSYEMQFGPDIWNTEIESGVTFSQKFQEEILEKMINDEIILQDAAKKELTVSVEEINTQFDELKKSIDSQEQFKSILESNGIDDEFLKEQVKKDMTVKKYYDTLMQENEVKEDEVRKYYDEHIDEFTSSQVKASHILFAKKDFDKNEELSKEEVAKKKELAEKVLGMAKNGQNFADLAMKYSDDPGSAKNGGDLGYFDKNTMVKEFSDAAFSMKQGDISDSIVETEFGFHIIKLFDKKENVEKFEDVKQSIASNLQYQKYESVIDGLKKAAKVKKNEDVIKEVREEFGKKQEEKAKKTDENSETETTEQTDTETKK